jgi:hypothetical protein
MLFRRIDFPTTDHSSQRSLISNTFDYVIEKLAPSHAAMNSITESRSNEESIDVTGPTPAQARPDICGPFERTRGTKMESVRFHHRR